MAGTPETILPSPSVDRRWLWAVRIAALASVLLLCVPLRYVVIERDIIGGFFTAVVLIVLLAQAHYGMILSRLGTREVKRGLALAAGWGLVVFLVMSLLVLIVLPTVLGRGEDLGWLINFALFTLAQAVLVATAIKTFYTMRRERGDVRMLLGGVVKAALYYPVIMLVVFLVAPPAMFYNPGGNQARPVRSIKSINECAATYASRHPEVGFPRSLDAMGPGKENCIDARLVEGRSSYYFFTYTPGEPDASGRTNTYTIQARAVHFEQGTRRFFSDESGIIRRTAYRQRSGQQREATAEDPPIPE